MHKLIIHFALVICVSKLTEGQSLLQNRGAEVDVKRLPKRPAPPRFGRKLTEAQKACFCFFLYVQFHIFLHFKFSVLMV